MSQVTILNSGIISTTESWLTPEIDDNLLRLPSYELFRSDRQSRRDGGVCTLAHERFRPSIFAHLLVLNALILLLLTCMLITWRHLKSLMLIVSAKIIIGGDFNDFDAEDLSEFYEKCRNHRLAYQKL